MFLELQRLNERPAVFSQHTTADLWTDPHTSAQMLRHHLDGSVDISSHRTAFIEAAVAWIIESFGLVAGSRVLDLGCGPGLYTHRLARAGIDVTGVDFSARSIAYARRAAHQDGLPVTYVEADYLTWEPDRPYGLVTMIMRDLCAIGPDRRRSLLGKIERLLEPGGAFLFDVDSLVGLEGRKDSASYSCWPDGGFWSPNPYFEFVNDFVYPDDAATVSRHVIVEADRTRTVCNWTQHFSPQSLGLELERTGLRIGAVLGDATGRPFDPQSPQFAVVARRP